jgi:ribosomal protein L19
MKAIKIKKIDTKKNNNKTYNTQIKRGSIIFIKYLLLKEDEIKIATFIGLCVLKKKKSNTLVLKNNIKKENVKLVVHAHSPLILKVRVLKKYNKKYRLAKLYYK